MPISLPQCFWWLEIYSSSARHFRVGVSGEVILNPPAEAEVTSKLKREEDCALQTRPRGSQQA